MSNYLDLSARGYQIERELGKNLASGCLTYKATQIETNLPVAIKEFQLGESNSTWTESTIDFLKQLNHPSIPKYIDSFQTPLSFYLVQEYKQAISISQPRHFTLEEVKQIAVAILEILVYLQQQQPPVIHRDIKPENILVERSEQLKVMLVDFAFAAGCGNVAVSSTLKGTLGFIPPEQIFSHNLSLASDLYSLGITLICLLTKTKSTEIGKLIDDSYCVNFQSLLPKLNPQFINWLEKMTSSNPKYRFSNALAALNTLKQIDLAVPNNRRLVFPFTHALKNITTIIGLASVGSSAIIGGSFVSFTSPNTLAVSFFPKNITSKNSVEQLLTTKNCPYCDLRGIDLKSADLRGANLQGAKLQGATLKNVNFQNANLQGINLEGASMWKANFNGANLENAQLTSADMGYAYFNYTNLASADMTGVYLVGAKLSSANLKEANLVGANLVGAKFIDANLQDAKLEYANLWSADLNSANLQGANMKSANLKLTQFSNGNLRDSILIGTNLEEASLWGADLKHALMPDGSKHH